jgi:hypothetical protein
MRECGAARLLILMMHFVCLLDDTNPCLTFSPRIYGAITIDTASPYDGPFTFPITPSEAFAP